MLILANTTDTLRAVLNAAHTTAPHRIVAFFRDIAAGSFTPGRRVVDSNGTTAVDAVQAPSSGVARVVDFMSVFNADSVAKTTTVLFNDNGTVYELAMVTLGPGERLEYQDGQGWRTFTNSGGVKQTTVQGTNPTTSGFQVGILAADETNNNATANTMQDVTGLSFPVTTGRTYWFRFIVNYTAAATTTGSRWSISGPTFSRLAYRSQYSATATAENVNPSLVNYDLPVVSSAGSGSLTGNMATVEGQIEPTADGSVIARFASEIASSAIVAKRGSLVLWMDVT